MYNAHSFRELVHAVGIYWLLRPYAALRGGCCHDHTHLVDIRPKHGALSGSAQAQEVPTVCLPLSPSFWALSRLSHQQLFCPLVRISWRDWLRFICVQGGGTSHIPGPWITAQRGVRTIFFSPPHRDTPVGAAPVTLSLL